MAAPNFLTVTEQVAAHLRAEVLRGRWDQMIVGRNQLAKELEVNCKTVEAALCQLEEEGLLVGQGAGRKRLIVQPGGRKAVRQLRVAILLHEPDNLKLDYVVELQHALEEAGHRAIFSHKSLMELGMSKARTVRLVNRTAADAWVVLAASREILEWFSTREEPTFALFGRRDGLPVAASGPDKPSALATAARRLIELGHQRIILLARRMRRFPDPGRSERAFLDELEAHDIPVGEYNLPDGAESAEGLHELLNSLFLVTPPTALILDEAILVIPMLQFLAERGLRVPEDVSLICTDPDPSFLWSRPSIAHIRWESRPIVRRIVNWAANVSRGRSDLRQSHVQAEFIEGGSIGAVME